MEIYAKHFLQFEIFLVDKQAKTQKKNGNSIVLQNTKVNMKNEKSKSRSKKIRKRKRRRKRRRKNYEDNFEHYILIKYQDISKMMNLTISFRTRDGI